MSTLTTNRPLLMPSSPVNVAQDQNDGTQAFEADSVHRSFINRAATTFRASLGCSFLRSRESRRYAQDYELNGVEKRKLENHQAPVSRFLSALRSLGHRKSQQHAASDGLPADLPPAKDKTAFNSASMSPQKEFGKDESVVMSSPLPCRTTSSKRRSRREYRLGNSGGTDPESFLSTPASSPLSIWKDSTPPGPQRIMSRGRPVPREIRWDKAPSLSTPLSDVSCLSSSEEYVPTDSPLARPKRISRFNRNRQRLDLLLASQRENNSEQADLQEAIRRLEDFKDSNPSPLRVSFHALQAAEKQSRELHWRLEDVKMDARRIGIAIARARMIEEAQHNGNGEGLWVNRVFT